MTPTSSGIPATVSPSQKAHFKHQLKIINRLHGRKVDTPHCPHAYNTIFIKKKKKKKKTKKKQKKKREK